MSEHGAEVPVCGDAGKNSLPASPINLKSFSKNLDKYKYTKSRSPSLHEIDTPEPPVDRKKDSTGPYINQNIMSHKRNRITSDSDQREIGPMDDASGNDKAVSSCSSEELTVDLKSLIRCSYGTLSQNRKLLESFTKSPPCSTSSSASTGSPVNATPDLSEKIKAAYSSLSSGAKRRRIIIQSSDDEDSVESSSQTNAAETNSDSIGVLVLESNGVKAADEKDLANCSEVEQKEKCLSEICKLFSNLDYMEAQDILVRHEWSLSQSIEYLNSKRIVNGNVVVPVSIISRKKSKSNGAKRLPIKCDRTKGVNFDSDDSSDEVVYRISKSSSYSSEPKNRISVKSSRVKKKKTKIGSSDNVDSDDLDGLYDRKDDVLYDSDESVSDDDTMTPIRTEVLNFFQTAMLEELLAVRGCGKGKAEIIMERRPFTGWRNLVEAFRCSKALSTDLLNASKDMLTSRQVVTKLMENCEKLSKRLETRVSRLMSEEDVNDDGHLKEQPSLLNSKLKLTSYQLLGVNWLVLLHRQKVNGILADEMGLGKTIQATAFLSYLLQEGDGGPHLIVVPASTLDNWVRELNLWSPELRVLLFQGNKTERTNLRMDILSGRETSFNVIVTTYSIVIGCPEDRSLFRRLRFNYVIFDEAHLLKNMETQRYQHLIKVLAKRRLLLTGTPLQNNLVELISLLAFVMPNMFDGKKEHLKLVFSTVSRDDREEFKGIFEKDQIAHVKQIMKPFFLRRLKSDVLKDLPKKEEVIVRCPMNPDQQQKYKELVHSFARQARDKDKNIFASGAGIGMVMELRKLANHSLLLRYHYTDEILRQMAHKMLKEPTHWDASEDLILEDMQVMSDFELHKLCCTYKHCESFALKPHQILYSGKFDYLDDILPEMKAKGDRVLLFSQFVMVLDIIEEYMKISGHNYIRLDGQTPVDERLDLIDQYTNDNSIFVFLLSTKAGGLGINLTAANTVILHDIDFNPYNDKQAEDRCHRVGQTKCVGHKLGLFLVISQRSVTVIRLVSRDTIEEHILHRATKKLKLEQDLTSQQKELGKEDSETIASLLKKVLELS